MSVSVKSNELKLVLDRLDDVKLELLRLRSILLPEEEATEQEKREIKKARSEISKGSEVSLQEFVKELGC